MQQLKKVVATTASTTVDGQEKNRWFPLGHISRRTKVSSSSTACQSVSSTVGSTCTTSTRIVRLQQPHSPAPAAADNDLPF